VADLVLDLAGERELPAQGRRAHDPVALRQHAHELGVGVHLDELQDGGAVLVGHPVVGLDLATRPDVREERVGVTGLVGGRGLSGWIVSASCMTPKGYCKTDARRDPPPSALTCVSDRMRLARCWGVACPTYRSVEHLTTP
jgi:hypothetical protein